ncbi:transcriptional activator protein acu-15 [Podospora australis]|uniref:Transcriptional activator protein acu-15 n=1 Tax=Podospora australis TaxID=1536484 RepID=A0AAN6WXS5_9PEZI|nr:transcriptional activator protein acu-15 [Podospora australis]
MSRSPPAGSPTPTAGGPGAAGSSSGGPLSPAGSPVSASTEPLACVSCRSRKLKCDRKKPVCTRCLNAGGDCVYPESRRKPAFKRRNVRELEERLAQVEGLLKNVAGKQKLGTEASYHGSGSQQTSPGAFGEAVGVEFEGLFSSPQGTQSWFSKDGPSREPRPQSWELLGLGQFESMPPFQMIEELHTIFFETQNQFMPLLQRNKYLREFHSPPHMRPPMCLQYAIWTMAALDHPKYGRYHDVFYKRARQYLEADELRGYGEHFITIAHAQTWAMIASDEARRLLFTRGAMSSARCVRLVGMMGLHRLDCTYTEEEHPVAEMLLPARDWTELEERRRVFWGAFCIDSYASLSTGWPTMIDLSQTTTYLPASEEAYANGKEEKSSTLPSVFNGAGFSTFAGNVLVCSIFNQLMKHCHRPMPDDHPEDPEFGKFWMRHREMDNTLSSAFMFLPERLRLPENITDHIAVQTNLNLHAAVMCLHNVAIEKAEKYGLPDHIKQASKDRSMTSTKQVTEIVKATSQMRHGYKSPLMALSLYCAATVHLMHARDTPGQVDTAGLEILIRCMDTVGKNHIITRAYFNQIMLDLEENGIYIPTETPTRCINPVLCGERVPLVARNSAARQKKLPSPFPIRLPSSGLLGPGYIAPTNNAANLPSKCVFSSKQTQQQSTPVVEIRDDINPHAKKRARTSASAGSDMPPSFGMTTTHETPRATNPVDGWPSASLFGYPSGYAPGVVQRGSSSNTDLPYRTGSPSTSTTTQGDLMDFSMPNRPQPPPYGFPTPTNLGGNNAAFVAPTTLNTNNMADNMDVLDVLDNWEVPDPEAYYAMVADMFRTGGGNEMATETSSQSNNTVGDNTSNDIDPWALLNDGSWDTTTHHTGQR